jgi:peptide/nickel transport system permease protein
VKRLRLAWQAYLDVRRRHPLLFFVGRRLALAVLTLLVVSVLIFVGTQILPGDVANAILGRNATPQGLASLRHQLGLDRPASARYFSWLGGILHGDLGHSAAGDVPVWSLISGRLANSAILAGITVAFLVPLSLLLGILAATRAGRAADHAISATSLALIAVPEFVTGTLLILVFAVAFSLLPAVSLVAQGANPLTHPTILVLPVATLLAASLAQTLRMVRAGMVDVLRSDYVEMARLDGFSERRVVLQWGLRNALAPAVQVIALNVQWLVGGIVVTEYLFGYPGLGQGLVQAVSSRDIPLVQAVTLLIAAFYLAVNIAADLLVVLMIPKLRTAQ